MILIVITLKVSNTGIHNTASTKAPSPIPSSANRSHCWFELMAKNANTDISMPNISVPPSPINIFDLTPKTLCRKNGSSAAITISVRLVITGLHTVQNAMPKHTLANIP